MTHPEGVEGVPAEMVNQLASVTKALSIVQLIAESTVGYRAKLIEGGVGEDAADRMTEAYHEAILDMMKTRAAADSVARAAVVTQKRRR